MKTISIGDIHGSSKWKAVNVKNYDRVIFMGDYVDDFPPVTDDQIVDAISKAHDLGGIVICNHIPWSINEFHIKTHPTRETLLEWGIDYFEIVNDDCKPENVYDQESDNFCSQHKGKVGRITGTDMHRPDRLMSGGVHGWTLMNVTEFSEKALMEELKNKNTEIIYSKKPYLDPGIHLSNLEKEH